MTLRTHIRETIVLAAPMMATLLAQISMGLVDTLMVGRLGAVPLAGVALGNSIYVFLFVVCVGFVTAVTPMVSQAFGAGRREPVERSVRQGLWLAASLALVGTPLVYLASYLLGPLGQAPEVQVEAGRYLRAVCWGLLPALSFVVVRNFVEALARPLLVTLVTLGGVLLNVAANDVLMYGRFGLPELGIAGTAWATVLVNIGLFLVLALLAARLEPFREYRIFTALRSPDPTYFRELLRLGWPIGASFGVEHGLFMMTAVMMGVLGAEPLAAHQIAVQCASITFMMPLGIGLAASVRVGQAAGRGDALAARRAGFVAMGLAALVMSGTAVLFWTLPGEIARLFLEQEGNEAVLALAVDLLGIAAVFQIFDGVQVAANGSLRGLKDTRTPMLIAFLSYWGIGLVVGASAGLLMGGGARGLWWGLVSGLAVAAVLLTRRFRRLVRVAAEREPSEPAVH